ncbi:MAG: hypothetical protein AAF633_14410 [Chloroflexota bacterium]
MKRLRLDYVNFMSFIGLSWIAAFIFFCGFVGLLAYRQSQLNLIERATGINLPTGLTEVQIHDNFVAYIVVHARLPEEEITRLLGRSSFQPIEYDPGELDEIAINNWIVQADNLRAKNRVASADAELYGRFGENDVACWNYVVDKKSGRLWFAYAYPDSSEEAKCPWGRLP